MHATIKLRHYPNFKTGQCRFQNRPLGVKPGQYLFFLFFFHLTMASILSFLGI
jgi:hypothetical protein